jgi:hypothetical protein
LLGVVCLLATCLGLGRADPLWGALAAAAIAPALARTAEVVRQLRRAGRNPGNRQKLAIFLGSLLLVAGAAAAVGGAALLTAAAGWCCGRLLGQVWDAPWLPVVFAAWSGVLGLPPGIVAAAALVQRWRPAALPA